ncbi:MAG TPA: metal ABC transporter permease [Abditibacteriaceae bacterium]|jgi:manganese/zinc/iron transport system permease protein
MFHWLASIDWTDANLRWVVMGAALLGAASAILGCFAFLRGRALMGDALAHAALPGVCAAFLLTGTKNLGAFLLGAAVAGLAAAWCIGAITRHSRVKNDSAQALVLSVFFGAGIVLLTTIQRMPSGHQSGLDKFLFGQAASLVGGDVRAIAFVAVALCAICALGFKEWKLLCFDSDFARGLGRPTNILDSLLMTMIVAAVVIGLQAVGVVLMAAMLITPPAAARFWTDKLGVMTILAGVFGAASGAAGAIFSTLQSGLPTGPLVVLSATAIFAVSLFFAPRRGIVARVWRIAATQKTVQRENLLRDVYELTEDEQAAEETTAFRPDYLGVPLRELAQKRHATEASLRGALDDLQKRGWIRQTGGRVALTQSGARAAYDLVRRHRLWETFLMFQSQLGATVEDDTRAHRGADAVEHFVPPDAMEQLEVLLKQQGREPRLRPSEMGNEGLNSTVLPV